MRMRRKFLAMLAWLAIAASANAAPIAPSPAAITIVLVHGALIDGSSWRGVYAVLTKDGYRVKVVQQPLTGFDDDVAATKRVIAQSEGPIILVGHSYGGAIITAAGVDAKVKSLVYVAALQPDVGQSGADAAPPNPDAAKDFRQTPDGFISLDPSKFAADFGADLPKALVSFMADSQKAILGASFGVKLTVAAWRDKPSYAIIATDDRALNPKVAQEMARRAGSKIVYIKASHAVHISQPRAVARVIESAARDINAAR